MQFTCVLSDQQCWLQQAVHLFVDLELRIDAGSSFIWCNVYTKRQRYRMLPILNLSNGPAMQSHTGGRLYCGRDVDEWIAEAEEEYEKAKRREQEEKEAHSKRQKTEDPDAFPDHMKNPKSSQTEENEEEEKTEEQTALDQKRHHIVDDVLKKWANTPPQTTTDPVEDDSDKTSENRRRIVDRLMNELWGDPDKTGGQQPGQ